MEEPLRTRLLARSGVIVPAVLELYLSLHRSPELSGFERGTAARFADAIAAAGLDVTRGVGGHGVVGVLANGNGPTVMVRCDLDALPVEERTGLAYASRVRARGADGIEVPVMHACGHDVHTAAVAGAAQLLAEFREQWSGTLVVVGQPAEETLTGARAMLADGLYSRFPRPDVVLAQHVAPFQAGVVAHGTGPMTAASMSVEAVVHGRGGHSAAPHAAINPIEIVSAVVSRIAALRSPGDDPHQQSAVTVGALHAGNRANVIPDEARLSISLRGFSDSRLTEALTAVRDILHTESAAAGCPRPPTLTVTSEAACNVNDPYFATVVRDTHTSVFGAERIVAWRPLPAAEDFPLYGAAGVGLHGGPPVPTVYWMVGSVGRRQWARTPGTTVADKLAALPVNHSPEYAPEPVPTLRTAVTAMAAGALGCFTDEAWQKTTVTATAGRRGAEEYR